MDNLEAFKSFLKTIPSIKDDVVSKKYTWQQIYEIYTLYGPKDDFFKPYLNRQNDQLHFMDIVKNIDFDGLASSLQSIEKVLNMVNSLMSKNDTKDHWYDEK